MSEPKEVQQAIVSVAQIHQSMSRLNEKLNIVFKTQKERDAEKLLNEMKQSAAVKHRIELLVPKETVNENNRNAQRVAEERLKNPVKPEPVVIQAEHLSLSDELHSKMTKKNRPDNIPVGNQPPIAESGGSTPASTQNAAPAVTGSPAVNSDANNATVIPPAPSWKG